MTDLCFIYSVYYIIRLAMFLGVFWSLDVAMIYGLITESLSMLHSFNTYWIIHCKLSSSVNYRLNKRRRPRPICRQTHYIRSVMAAWSVLFFDVCIKIWWKQFVAKITRCFCTSMNQPSLAQWFIKLTLLPCHSFSSSI